MLFKMTKDIRTKFDLSITFSQKRHKMSFELHPAAVSIADKTR